MGVSGAGQTGLSPHIQIAIKTMGRDNMRKTALLAAVIMTAIAATPVINKAFAQEWPQRPVKFIVPFGPGSSADTSARIVGERLQAIWKHRIVVEPRPGGDAMISLNAFIGANDDHTFFFGPSSAFVAHPHRYAKLNYNRERDIIPIAQMSSTMLAFAVPGDSKWTSLKDFIDDARANPGKYNVAAAPGSSEMQFDAFIRSNNLQIVKVPYRDIVQAANDVTIGRLHALYAAITIFQSQMPTGKIKVLAISGDKRAAIAPGAATAAEQGQPFLALEGLMGLFGSRATTPALRERIAADFLKIVTDPSIAAKLGAIGQVHNPGDTARFTASIDAQAKNMEVIAKTIGMQPK
ncbi:MAG: tripartite tricarboxylate transporter substrate binding protein [Alphaproteobacteria bacterium]|nr:tripartite tricarboxylate transporter substrate binding protein [Alphaproteobacteria bacterium]